LLSRCKKNQFVSENVKYEKLECYFLFVIDSFCFISFQIRLKPQNVCRVIVACAILHNIAVLLREPLIDSDDDQDQEPVPPFAGVQDGRSVSIDSL
jgi:hypothetical protein